MSLIIKTDGSTRQRKHTSHDTWHRLEKRPRAPARAKPWKPTPGVKLTEAGLSQYEAELGVAAVGYDVGVIVGRILGYDQHRNVFTIVGKRLVDRKAVEARFSGSRVSSAILAARYIAGVKSLKREMSGR
jgi:hypothetical protein